VSGHTEATGTALTLEGAPPRKRASALPLRRFRFCSAFALATATTPPLAAAPEWNSAAVASVCGLGQPSSAWGKTASCNGVRADILFGRTRNRDFAVGPYLTLSSANFADLRLGAGASVLLPTFDGDFPFVISVGGISRDFVRAGLGTSVFFGLRSHNLHGGYAMASGLMLGADAELTGPRRTTLVLGLQLDGLWLALPFLLCYEWLSGGPN
jgi:hypothetical protein